MASILWPNAGKEANKLSFDEELLCSSVRSVTLLPHNVLDTILERCGQPPPQPQSNLNSKQMAPVGTRLVMVS